jgi:hypothetical protein
MNAIKAHSTACLPRPRCASARAIAQVIVAAAVCAGFAGTALRALDGPGAGPPAATAAPPSGPRQGVAVFVRVEAAEDPGRGMAGASVELSAPAPFAAGGPCQPLGETGAAAAATSALSAEDGGAVLRAGEQGVWHLVVRAPGKVPAQAFVALTAAEEAVAVASLAPCDKQEVRVTGDGGEPLDGVSIVAESSDLPMTPRFPWTDPVLQGESAGGGMWRLPAGTDRIWRLGASRVGYAPSSGGLVGERLRLRAEAPRLLRLVDAHGEPLAGARLWDAATCASLGATDAGGTVALVPALSGRRLVVAARDGRRWGGLPVVPGGAHPEGTLPQWRLPEPRPALRGRLVAAQTGRAVAGALVWSGEDPASWTRSDPTGRFRLPWPVRGDAVEVHVHADGFLPLAERRRAGGSDLEIVLWPARPLAGQVVDETGQPVAEAEVMAVPQDKLPAARARTGADGSFLLREIWPDKRYMLSAAAAGHGPGAVAFESGSAASAGAGQAPERSPRLVLCRQMAVTATVHDAMGGPVAGATVTLPGPAHPVTLRSAADGTFELQAPPRAALDLSVSAPGFLPLALTWKPPARMDDERQCQAGREPPRIELDHGFTLEAKVTDGRGRPLGEAEIWDRPPVHRLATSGPDGRLAVPGLATRGEQRLCLSRLGFDPIELVIREPVRRQATLVLDEAAGIEGRVDRQDGSPAADVEVKAVPTHPQNPNPPYAEAGCAGPWYGPAVRTDAQGHFLITPLAPEWYTVAASDGAQGFAESDRLEVHAGARLRGQHLVLGAATRIVGRVRDAAGEPVSATVFIERLYLSHDTDEEGRFALGPLRPGDEMVRATANGGVTVSRLLSLHPGDNELELILPAHALRRISGRLVDAYGAGVAGERLVLVSSGYHDDQQAFETNPDGSFVFELVSEGRYGLKLMETFAEHQLAPATLEVTGGDLADLLIQILDAADITVRGRVLGGKRRRAVEVMAMGAGESRAGQVDADGSYRIEHLVPGRWGLTASDGEVDVTTEIDLPAEPAEVVQDLVFSPHQVSGRLVDGQRNPVAGAQVSLVPGPHRATTSADGQFALSVEDDSYDVEISCAEQPPNKGVHAAPTVEVDGHDVHGLELTCAGAAIHGKLLGLRPYETGATVYLASATGRLVGDSTAPGADGSFEIKDVAPGRWQLHANLDDGEKAEVEFTVPPDAADVAVELTFVRGIFALTGQLSGAADPALFSVTIRRQDGAYIRMANVDSSGAFRFTGLAPGDYLVTAQAHTDDGTVDAGSQVVTLAASDVIALAVDPSVRAVRHAPQYD